MALHLRDGLISNAHHSPVCGKTYCREEHGSRATTYHSIVTGAWRIVFTSTANHGARSPISLTRHRSRVDFLSQWDTMSVGLHIAAYAGAKLTGFIGEQSSPADDVCL